MKPKLFSGPKGLKILICNRPDNLSTSLLVLVKAGTDFEKKEVNGIFHFIEHLLFKGTKNFPSVKILMENLDKIGSSYNAFTSHQYTGFYIKVLPEFTKDAIFILSDIILNPLFPDGEIENERKVIFEEINSDNDNPRSAVIDYGWEVVFGDQPAGWPVIGTKDRIAKITKEDILKYFKKTYTTKNILIVLSGKINEEKKLIEFLKKRFSLCNSGKLKNYPYCKEPKKQYLEKISYKNVEQAHLFLGFPLPGFFKLKNRRYHYYLISIILGGKSSSRLWLKVREELGAAYYIRSSFVEYTNRSLLFIHAGLNLDKLDFILENIVEEINNLKKEGPTEEELKTAKSVLKSSLFMNLEESLNLASFYGRQYLLEQELKSPQEIIKNIDALTPKDISEELRNFFKFNQAKLAIILPKKYKINFAKIFQKLI